jgi:hypothetical protein
MKVYQEFGSESLLEIIERLEVRIRKPEQWLNKNSINSSKPPSSDRLKNHRARLHCMRMVKINKKVLAINIFIIICTAPEAKSASLS